MTDVKEKTNYYAPGNLTSLNIPPDPFILSPHSQINTSNTLYYAYATNSGNVNIQVMSSKGGEDSFLKFLLN